MGLGPSSPKKVLEESLHSSTRHQGQIGHAEDSYKQKPHSDDRWPVALIGQSNRWVAFILFSYSGSDIANLVNDALMTPVRSLDKVRVW